MYIYAVSNQSAFIDVQISGELLGQNAGWHYRIQ